MEEKLILALDQGTSSSRALLVNKKGQIIAIEQEEFPQYYPKNGWVEQNPMEIWSSQMKAVEQVLIKNNISAQQIDSIGITNQRETTIIWDKTTGKPIYNAIVWQDKRTADTCSRLADEGWKKHIQKKTGLVIDSYFSGTKIHWLLQNMVDKLDKTQKERLIFGTVDTWLLWNLTKGEKHCTDYTNASRTMLFDIKKLKWDEKILERLSIPRKMLPEVQASSSLFGYAQHNCFGKLKIPITGIAGDQQAALFGQTGFKSGMAKNTYGTGCFILMNTGTKKVISTHGLITTLTCGTKQDKPKYALEGSVFIAGAAIKWLRDAIKLIDDPKQTQEIAANLPDTDGVYVVPAFSGLGAPHWDMYAKGAILGLTLNSTNKHIIKATLESLAYQSRDVINAMEKDAECPIKLLNVDGGASANNYLMQFQADILNGEVHRPENIETTALGAAYLAGLANGFWKNKKEINAIRKLDKIYIPTMEAEKREMLYKGWIKATKKIKSKQKE